MALASLVSTVCEVLALPHSGGVLLLVPADPLRRHRADDHFAAEAAPARDARACRTRSLVAAEMDWPGESRSTNETVARDTQLAAATSEHQACRTGSTKRDRP